MSNVPSGRRFSHNHLRVEQALPDSQRARKRIALLFQDSCAQNSLAVGNHLERELGISMVAHNGVSSFVPWTVKFEKIQIRDVLDCVTLICQYCVSSGTPRSQLLPILRRIFEEERLSYIIDDEFGVHPLVDVAFSLSYHATVRSLSDSGLVAARTHLEAAEVAMIDQSRLRDAVRSVFDAAENVFRQTFPKAPALNGSTINQHLKGRIDQLYSADRTAVRASQKVLGAMVEWVDACHNYRHEPGQPVPTNLPDELAVMLISEGFSKVRWLADIKRLSGSAT